jgi:hypothetical protein
MTKKNILLLFLSVLLFSCHVNSRRKAEEIIDEFKLKKEIDKRQTIFEVEGKFKNGQLLIEGETDNSALKSELLSLLNQLDIKDKIIVLPDSTVGNKTFGLINISVANLRSALALRCGVPGDVYSY